MGLQLLFILALSFFKSSRFIRKFYFITFKKLKNKYNLKIYLSDPTFSKYNRVILPHVSIFIHGKRLIEIEGTSLILRFVKPLKFKTLGSAFQVIILKINLRTLTLPKKDKVPNRTDKVNPPFGRVIKVISTLKIVKWLPSLEINKLTVGDHKNICLAISIQVGGFSLVFSHENDFIKVGGTICIKKFHIMFNVNNLSLNDVAFSVSLITIDCDFLENKYLASIFTEIPSNLRFSPKRGNLEEFLNKFSIIKLGLLISVESSKIEVLNNSFLQIETLTIPVRGAVYEKTWPILGVISVIDMDESITQKITSRFKNTLFTNVNNLRFTLTIIFRLNLLNIQEPDLRMSLKSNDDFISKIKYGFNYLNNSFSFFQKKENGLFTRYHFDLEENEYFIPVSKVNKLFINLLLLAEDPNFYFHKGFDPHFLGKAIIQNFKKGKIIRGASTITMQVVKNLFLSGERAAIRKIEEISIALLIENVYSISKDRIMELYINLIELAPNIYGLVSGCRFYFSKHPNDLTITEMLVVLYIIPRPLHFYDALKAESQQLKRNLGTYLRNSRDRLFVNRSEFHESSYEIESCINFNKHFGKLDLSDYL